jgi:nucleotide-binding universal stress UspA family protein
MRNMNKINTVLVAFSATFIHMGQAKKALDMAEKNKAKLIILSVRDKNISQMVANVSKDHGFLGRDVVKKLTDDIKKDRDELIDHRLGLVEKEAVKHGIDFKTVKIKGKFEDSVFLISKKYDVDLIIIEASNKHFSGLNDAKNYEIITV